MGTRTLAQFHPTPNNIAKDAFIYGFAGHSLVTPHFALKQLWWTDERIKAKVTDKFIFSKFRGEERAFLARPVGFGEDLTDETYLDWIKDRARRLFLILSGIGVPDQIFGCIDDSWNDDDLPIARADVHNLELAIDDDKNEVLSQKFYDKQFIYLLRELSEGKHIDYGPNEHIPMEHVSTLPPAVSLQIWDRIHFPGRPDDVYMRRKYTVVDKENEIDLRPGFLQDVRKAQGLQHEHIAPVWASYTTGDSGYVVSTFVGEHTLATFINHRNPTSFQRVRPSERPLILCQWMHCLADALASIHYRHAAHTAIRPSNVLIDHSNHIAFADVGSLRTFQRGKKAKHTEAYEYAAPETPLAHTPFASPSSPPMSSKITLNKLRKLSSSTSGSSSDSSNGRSTRRNSWYTAQTSPSSPSLPGSPTSPTSHTRSDSIMAITTSPSSPALLTLPTSPTRSDSIATVTSSIPPTPKSPTSTRNFSRHLTHSSISSTTSTSPSTIIHLVPTISAMSSNPPEEYSEAPPQISDIFSLGCIYLDILTFLLRGKTNDFVKFRSSRLSTANKTKTHTDTSFQFNLDKIEAWIVLLKEESRGLPEQIYRGVPALLDLISTMLAERWSERPDARHVRDQIQEIMAGHCGVEDLCCKDRVWAALPPSEDQDDRERALNAFFRDSMSAAGAPSERSRPASQAMSSREASVSGGADEEGGDGLSPTMARPGSSMANLSLRSWKGRRGSEASGSTVRVSSWRRAFSRGSVAK